MTAFRIVDTSNPVVQKILTDMEKFQPIGSSILNKSSVIKVKNVDFFCYKIIIYSSLG